VQGWTEVFVRRPKNSCDIIGATEMSIIREPAVSGTFYASNADLLKADIEGYLQKASTEQIEGNIIGLVAPHAGYMYSGQTAAHGYKTILNRHYDTVIVVAPSHQAFFYGGAIQDKGAYRTPLGTVDIDEEFAARLLEKGGEMIQPDPKMHRGEHSIEVQIPFLQTVLKDFRIVPVIQGMSQDTGLAKQMGELLYDCVPDRSKSYLIVGSTDLSHYYPYDLAKDLDKGAAELIGGFDIEGLDDELPRGKYEACGAGSIISAMVFSKKMGATHSKVLDYKNSGDVTGDMSSVVGYLSCVLYE
jgi:MEMO1 family protein